MLNYLKLTIILPGAKKQNKVITRAIVKTAIDDHMPLRTVNKVHKQYINILCLPISKGDEINNIYENCYEKSSD